MKKETVYLTFLTVCFLFLVTIFLLAIAFFFNHIYVRGDLPLVWKTSIALMVLGVGAAFFLYLRERFLLRLSALVIKHSKKESKGVLVEALHEIRTVRAFGIEDQVFARWREKQVARKDHLILHLIDWAVPMVLLFLLLGFQSLKIYPLSMGFLFVFYLALFMLCRSWRNPANFFPKEDFKEIMFKAGKGAILEEMKGGIVFEKVSFPPLFEGFSIEIESQKKVILDLPKGRTTWVRLLMGLERPTSGTIRIDGIDLSGLDTAGFREQIGAVFRQEEIFSSTIYDNITAFRPCTESQVEKALDLSDFRQDVEVFKMGLNTLLPLGGGTLSAGQRRRLLLARALVHEPPILILDQGLDRMDEHSQRRILENLQTVESTQILISSDQVLKEFAGEFGFEHLVF